MAIKKLQISSILPGISPSQFFATQGQFLGSIGVDPDYPLTSSDIKTSGVLVPTRYEKFSGANVNSPVIKIITDPKDDKTYVILKNGRLISYDNALGTETLIGTVAGGVANGAEYYNNFIYIATTTDVSRFGPLNGAPVLTDNVWTGATLGAQTALTNTTYPTIRGVALPNHWMFAHIDSSLYLLDFKDGQGLVHKIKTKKVAVEGDTNDGSSYAVLRLPLDTSYFPTSLCGYSTDIAILAMNTTSATVNQGRSALFLWDALNFAPTAYREILIPDPMATAILDFQGSPVIWSGNAQSGVRITRYLGGQVLKQMSFVEEGVTPFQGAVTSFATRILWGAFTTYPATSASVFALGSKTEALSMGLHNIINTTSTGTTPIVTALSQVQQASNITPRWIVAWTDGSGSGIDKLSTTATFTSVFRSENFQVGKSFTITEIRIPLGAVTVAGMTVTVKILLDDASSSTTVRTINSTNDPSTRYVLIKSPDMLSLRGQNNFQIEFDWTGTVALPIQLPISVTVQEHEDEPYA